jgi:hypothetical protein
MKQGISFLQKAEKMVCFKETVLPPFSTSRPQSSATGSGLQRDVIYLC